METVSAALAAVALGVSGTDQAPARRAVTAARHAHVDVTVTLTRSARAAQLARVAIVTLIARGALGAAETHRTRALNLKVSMATSTDFMTPASKSHTGTSGNNVLVRPIILSSSTDRVGEGIEQY